MGCKITKKTPNGNTAPAFPLSYIRPPHKGFADFYHKSHLAGTS